MYSPCHPYHAGVVGRGICLLNVCYYCHFQFHNKWTNRLWLQFDKRLFRECIWNGWVDDCAKRYYYYYYGYYPYPHPTPPYFLLCASQFVVVVVVVVVVAAHRHTILVLPTLINISLIDHKLVFVYYCLQSWGWHSRWVTVVCVSLTCSISFCLVFVRGWCTIFYV